MPEGDTIFRTAAALRPRLAGQIITAAEPFRRLVGSAVTAVEPNGKHLLIHFDSGLVLHSHMGMTGSWHLYRPGEAWRKPRGLARAWLETASTVAVVFSAPTVELLRGRELQLGHLGPDILAADFDLAEALRRARQHGGPLGEVLLDQRVCAGIGNIHRCESLWALRLDPWRTVADTDEETLSKLYSEARRRLQAGTRRHQPHAVHGRGGRPCPRCATLIKVGRQGDPPRFTYHCPKCQLDIMESHATTRG